MPTVSAARDQILTRVQTQLVKDALAASGKGGVLSKAEQEKLDRDDVLKSAAMELRRNGGKGAQVRLAPLVDAAANKVIGALDGVDKPGRGKGKISRAEAREAVASKGDAGFRIGRAFELLTGASLEAKGGASPALAAAVQRHLAAQGFAVLSSLKADEPSAWVQKKIEDTLDTWGGDGVMAQGRLKLDGQTVHVATATTWKRDTLIEIIGLFDGEGRALGRARIVRDNDSFTMQMHATDLAGQAGAKLASTSAGTPPPKAWVDALKAHLKTKFDNGDDMGVDIDTPALPAALLPAYQFLERNTPDGTGLSRVDFQGRTAYVLHDYSCVSSHHVFTADGAMLETYSG